MSTACEKCGHPLQIGEHPFCPHGFGIGTNIPDDIPGGLTVENYGPHPITFYSHSERRAYMKAHGLVERETFAPLPGTGRDPQGIPNPNGYRSLSAAAILMRNGRGSTESPGAVGGPDFDPADRFDIPNDPTLGHTTPGGFNFSNESDPTQARTILKEIARGH